MPLIVKDYSWEETPSTLAISFPLKGVKKDKVTFFSTDEYIKASFPPYLFEVFLLKPVVDEQSVARIENGMIMFKLHKQEEMLWGQLCSDIMDDKNALKVKREEMLVKAQEKEKELMQLREAKRKEYEKHALKKAMDLDAEERDRIESIKESERKKATEELERWKEEQRRQALAEKRQLEDEARMQLEAIEIERRKQQLLEKAKRTMFEPSQDDAVRRSGKISVKFTPRVFPTASRESTKHLEDEWLKKQADARKIADIEDSDLTEEERNPVFMKDKGDKFFREGNFQAAINAYTHAIRLSQGKMPSLYSNRAACHIKIRNLIKAVEDASKALELLTPAVQQNAASRCKAHVRRGTAFCELELYVEGLQDYQAASKIFPENEQLKADAEKIRNIIQSSEG